MLLPSRLTSLPVLSLRSHNWPLIPPQRRHTTCATRQHANQRIGAHLDKNKADIVDQIRRVNLRFDGLEQNFETLFEAIESLRRDGIGTNKEEEEESKGGQSSFLDPCPGLGVQRFFAHMTLDPTP